MPDLCSPTRRANARRVALLLTLLGAPACSIFEASTASRGTVIAPEATRVVRVGQTTSRAFSLLQCGLAGLASDEDCARLATQEGTTATALRDPGADTVDQLSERLRTQAQAERMPIYERSALLRYFDLASAALREARHAALGLQCTRLEACAQRAHGTPTLEESELALHIDNADAHSFQALDGLLHFSREQGPFAPEAETLALLLLRWRGAAAGQARPEVLGEALTAWLAAAQRTLREAPAATAERDAHGARQTGEPTPRAPSLESAQERIELRLRQLVDRVEVPSLRTLVQQALATPTAPVVCDPNQPS